jgi:hypothetical protein
MPHGISHSKAQPADEQQRKSKTEQRAHAERQLGIVSRPFRLRFIFVEVSVHKGSSQLRASSQLAFPSLFPVPASLFNSVMNSMGSGKTIVVFFSTPMSARVCR